MSQIPQHIVDKIKEKADTWNDEIKPHIARGAIIGYQLAQGDIETLKAENSKMRKALEWYANAGNYITDRGEIASAYQRDRIADKATEALKTNTHG